MKDFTITIPIPRKLGLKSAAVVVGLGLGLLLCEVVARLFWSGPLVDRFTIFGPDTSFSGDCYPRARDAVLPIDLATPEGRDAFLRAFSKGVKPRWPDIIFADSPFQPFLGGISGNEAVSILERYAPLCAIYNSASRSPRRFDEPPGFKQTIALLGDSFVYGQGVADEQTLSADLAKALGARIISFADLGADMPQVVGQFGEAMSSARSFGVSKIIYFYVLNDPYGAKELEGRVNFLNDLMNIRFGVLNNPRHPHGLATLARLSSHSALARLLTFHLARQAVSRATVAWYRDIHDPNYNPRLLETFEKLGSMSREAAARGIDFVVMIYPLMLDMESYPLANVHATLRDLAARNGVELHDLLPAFQKHAGELLTVHPIDYHPNFHSGEIVAGEVAEYLSKRRKK